MNLKSFGIIMAGLMTLAACSHATMRDDSKLYIQIAQLEIDPTQLEAYRAAVSEQVEAAIRLEPGVLSLQALADKKNPAHITVFEIYASEEAYKAHLEAPHFKKYKTTVENMVTSLKLTPMSPVMLRNKRH